MTLSQEQINAILEGTGTYEESGTGDALESFFHTLSEKGGNAGSQAISQALGKSVVLSHPEVSVLSAEQLLKDTAPHQIMIQTGFESGKTFPLLYLIKDYDVAVIFDILMGKDGRNPDLEMGDLQISAIGEVMNQLIGAAATAISGEISAKLAMKTPVSESLNLEQQSLPQAYVTADILAIRYQLTIEGVLDSEIFELWPLEQARAFHTQFTAPAATPPLPTASTVPVNPHAPSPTPSYSPPPMTQSAGGYHAPPTAPSGPPPSVQPVQFAPLSAPGVSPQAAGSLDRILDIPLKVTVELGSSRLKVKNVLELTKGSVVELDKLSGEAVDLLVNGRLMARGEVVVVNENFGVRISEILGPEARLQHFSDGG